MGYIYIYIYRYVCMYIYMYVYLYIYVCIVSINGGTPIAGCFRMEKPSMNR